jgi:hypothetical protein
MGLGPRMANYYKSGTIGYVCLQLVSDDAQSLMYQLQTVLIATRPAQIILTLHNNDHVLFVPAGSAAAWAFLLFLHRLSSVHNSDEFPGDIVLDNVCNAYYHLNSRFYSNKLSWAQTKIRELNVRDILPYKIFRLSSLALLGLSIFDFLTAQTQIHSILISLICFYVSRSVRSTISSSMFNL